MINLTVLLHVMFGWLTFNQLIVFGVVVLAGLSYVQYTRMRDGNKKTTAEKDRLEGKLNRLMSEYRAEYRAEWR
jgi:hypothetical protein